MNPDLPDLPDHRDRPTVRLTGPDALICAVPYLLGFTPERSVVLVWVSPLDHEVVLTMRADLAAGTGEGGLHPDFARVLGRAALSVPTDSVPYLVAYPDADVDADDGLPTDVTRKHDARLPGASDVGAIVDWLVAEGRAPGDALCVMGDRWWSYLCSETSCCDLCGHTVDAEVAHDVEARFVVAGRAPRGTRDDLVAELFPAPAGVVRRMRTLISDTGVSVGTRGRAASLPMPGEVRRRGWRALALLAEHPGTLTLDDQALVLVALRDGLLRDAFLALTVRIANVRGIAVQREVADALAVIVVIAPRHFVAQAAACLAVLRYLEGDGARAWVAIDRARGDDPSCRLAALAAVGLEGALAPSRWRGLLSSLDPDDLREGRVAFGAA